MMNIVEPTVEIDGTIYDAPKHLWLRLFVARETLKPVQSDYRVVYTSLEEGAPASVLIPDPNWMAAALEGGILPPVECYLHDAEVLKEYCAHMDDPSQFDWGMIEGSASHTKAAPMGPMTEEQAIEYLIMKDIPTEVWVDHETSNQRRFRVVRTKALPATREQRNAWELSA